MYKRQNCNLPVTCLQIVASSTGINNVTMDSNVSNCPVYNMNGQRVGGSYKGVVIQNGKKRLVK